MPRMIYHFAGIKIMLLFGMNELLDLLMLLVPMVEVGISQYKFFDDSEVLIM